MSHKTGEHRIYLFTKNLAANFTHSTNQAGSSLQSLQSHLP